MKLFNLLTDLFNYGHKHLDMLAKPNGKYIHDKLEYEIAHMRHKALLLTETLMATFVLTDGLINGFSVKMSHLKLVFCIINSAAIILSCRYHPYVFKIMFLLLSLFYGPSVMNKEEGGVQRAWFISMIFPLYSYVFVGDLKFFLLQILIQMVSINKIYSPVMERSVMLQSPEDFTKFITYSTNASFTVYILMIVFIHFFMLHAHKRFYVVEQKKDEIENQKNFLLGFSHELRNLINSLTGNVKLASFEKLAPKAKELLLNAEVCGELLLHLINNILDTGKVEIGELEITAVSTRIYETLERIWGICSELIKRKNLKGKIKISNNIPKNLIIDHHRITQIFLNLVGNSVKFTETGSIDISVDWLDQNTLVDESCFRPYPFNDSDDYDEGLFEKQQAVGYFDKNTIMLGLNSHKIDLSLVKNPVTKTRRGILKIAVSDTGCGMSKEEIEKLFQKFSQVSSDTSKRKLGTGLGLFITKQLCQKMQGDIQAFSRKGSGSSFIFCIPADVVQEEHSLQDIASLQKFVKSRKLKAMIVDDASFNHAVLKNFFYKLGIDVADIAINGLEACQKYSQFLERGEPLHIITMDIEMPIMDGKEAVKRIRQLEADRGIEPCFIPIISANCSESEIAECLDKRGNIKADRFLKKPATLEELLRAIGYYFLSSQLYNINS